MKLINLTPHTIHLYKGGQPVKSFPSEGIVRVSEVTSASEVVDSIIINTVSFGKVENLPEPEEGTLYIVSSLVLSACKDRKDLVCPHLFVRNFEGQIVGCEAFYHY